MNVLNIYNSYVCKATQDQFICMVKGSYSNLQKIIKIALGIYISVNMCAHVCTSVSMYMCACVCVCVSISNE